MKQRSWRAIGIAAAIPLAIIAASFGVVALRAVVSILYEVRVVGEPEPAYRMSEGLFLAFLLISLAAAVTPFFAARFLFGFPREMMSTTNDRRLARRIGWLMTVVAVPWWLVAWNTLNENLQQQENLGQIVLQVMLSGVPALLATICALAAFQLSRMRPA